ncbi:AMP-binding protein [Conexibacter woesei]|uniref:AMP-dependent synthetase and ligase n=1 Tax=Conexibacter woesei (strain DSM 14684 / CCUG 47730 / CIP 108061 / JCM 11494 / NBRC 100937 / ID131577) TaxID=469383 RepID=D3F6J2_CONWI|nr:AMP-binding protein [Conexibacter woesei]ADB50759.1 AMP-dependent synthetase and ligase [Conexibacter woesei DSM 14684]
MSVRPTDASPRGSAPAPRPAQASALGAPQPQPPRPQTSAADSEPRPLHASALDAAARHPERVAAISVDGRSGEVRGRITYRELAEASARVAGGLRELGVGRGDVVSAIVPNRLEFSVLVLAISRLGAVFSGLPTAIGRARGEATVTRSGARVLVAAPGEPLALALALRDVCPRLEHVVALDGADAQGALPYELLAAAAPLTGEEPVDAHALAHIGFTSGTTGEPKGVMNTHATLGAVCRAWVEHVGGDETFGDPAVNLVASPVGHHTGFLWGALLSARLAATAVYLDRWIPAVAAETIARLGVTTMHGAPTFLQDLVRVERFDAARARSLRIVTLAGAPIPRELVPAAAARLDAAIVPAWGMTEYGIAISASPAMRKARLEAGDGVPVGAAQARVTRDGAPVATGEVGALEIRGPGLFTGYHEREDATREAFDADGWFATGDLASIADDGVVALQGRTKDIIVRGGENVPVAEVESTLFRHPDVVEAAVVAVPDERLGERALAVVAVVPGRRPPSLAELVDFCLAQGLSKHYLPEYVAHVEALPKTGSGKVLKTELRDRYQGVPDGR